MTSYDAVPDFIERKGSLFLRSNHMNYSRATLNSNWHQAREAEPRDYDMSHDPQRDLCKATYSRIGNITDGSLPPTTYQHMTSQSLLKDDFTEKQTTKPMVNQDTAAHVSLDRDTGAPDCGYGAVLPRHHPDHNKAHFETTHLADYRPPFGFTPAEEKPKDFADNSLAYKYCHSQFADTADYRRHGRNTWQDESGHYANSHLRAQCPVYQPRDPVLEAFR